MRNKAILLFLIFSVLFFKINTSDATATTAIATNQSTSTLCAEDDNINIPFNGNVATFTVEATHPTYLVGTDNCEANFTNCQTGDPGYPFTPGVFKLFDDGETAIEAVRESSWWRPTGMSFSVDAGDPVTDIHYIRVYRKIADANEWPQYFVLYMDGNMRLIPHPPSGVSSVCFGSSVIIGPTIQEARPYAEIDSANYKSSSKTIEVRYNAEGSAFLNIEEVNRTLARVLVTINYSTSASPFAVFRSMYVTDGNADVDHVKWNDISSLVNDDTIMSFQGGEGTEWSFYRLIHSQHNTSAPDIRIKIDSPTPSGIGNLVTWYYTSILSRAPEPGGAEGWTSEIERIGALGIDIKEGFIALGKLFFNSDEYLNMNTTDDEYIVDLYETFLGRTPSQGEVDYWAGELTGGLTRNLLLNYFIFSTEFMQYMESIFGDTTVRPEYNLLNDLYRSLLSRLPDDGGFNYWLGEMQTAQCNGDPQAIRDLTSQIALLFLNSQEYADRNTSNSEFIEDLYNGILRRGAELSGYLYWLGELDGGVYTRAEMLQLFVDSAEFQARVQRVIDAGCAY